LIKQPVQVGTVMKPPGKLGGFFLSWRASAQSAYWPQELFFRHRILAFLDVLKGVVHAEPNIQTLDR
jgi:hypothetical protein